MTTAATANVTLENGWLTDPDGNRASIEYFGSEDAARSALASLKRCIRCVNCSGCSRCSDCSDCSGCSDCSRCSDCSDCSRCSGCSGCSDCSRCSDCSGCSGCSRCSDCSGCSGCSRCSDCSGCSGCSRCSDCSGCSHVAWLINKRDLRGDPDADPTTPLGQPPIPKIENIDRKIFEAVSQPGALAMDRWHTCNTTHCRAGWAVHLAGEAGYALERYHNTPLAAQLIYRESGAPINPARFYDSNDDALADMRKRAEA